MMNDISKQHSGTSASALSGGSLGLTVVLAIGLFVGSLTVFWEARHHELVNWDDYRNLVETRTYRDLNVDSVKWMLTTRQLAHWQPVIWLSYALDYRLWGHQEDGTINPKGFHTTNILVHGLAVVIFFLVAKRLLELGTRPKGKVAPKAILYGAAIAAALFGWHPLRVESVAWVTDRLDVFATFWFLLTVLIYLHQAPTPAGIRGRWLALAMGTYLLAIGSKSIVMTLPAVLILLDFYPLRRLGGQKGLFSQETRAVWLEKVPFLVMGLGAALLGLWAKSGPGLVSLEKHGIESRVLQASLGIGFYLIKTIAPQKMIPLYDILRGMTQTSLLLLLAVGFTTLTTIVLIVFRRRWPWALAAWVFYVVTLAPVLGFTQAGMQVVADRYTYLGCLSIAVLAGAGMMHVFQRMLTGRLSWDVSALVVGLTGLVLLAFGVASRHQTRVWANSRSLWEHAYRVDPKNVVAMSHLGLVWHDAGASEQGAELLKRAIRLNPDYTAAHCGLATILLDRGAVDEAIYHFQEALRRNPDAYPALTGLAKVYMSRGQTEEATQLLERAVGQDRKGITVSVMNDLATSYIEQSRYEEAIAPLRSAILAAPREAMLHVKLGICLMGVGKRLEAANAYKRALELDPAMPEAMVNLANVYAAGGNYREAIKWYDRAIGINADVGSTHLNYGLVLAEQGDVDQAKTQLRKAIELEPTLAQAYHALAKLLAQDQESREEAVALWKKAIELKNQEYPEALKGLVPALMAQGKYAESVDYLKTSIRLNTNDVESRFKLGLCYSQTGRHAEAIQVLREGLRLAPNQADIGNSLAWLLATSKQDDLRDGAEAVRLAEYFDKQKADQVSLLDTLAAAYAEVGRFDQAVKTAERAVALLPKEGAEDVAAQMKARLELYKANKPFRE